MKTRNLFAALLSTFLLFAATLAPAAVTWNGGGASTNANWSCGTNWVGGTAPIIGTNLTFSGSVGLRNTNDFAAGSYFNQINLNANGFVLQGANALTLTNTSASLLNGNGNVLCSNVVNIPLVLSNTTVIQTTIASPAVGGSSITLNGGVNGLFQLSKDTAGAGGAPSVLYIGGGVSSIGSLNLRKGGLVIKNGASFTVTNATIGADAPQNGIDPYLEVDGASSQFIQTNGTLTLGANANNAKVIVAGGSFIATNAANSLTYYIAQNASANVTHQQSGGTTLVNTMRVNNGTALINLSGGTFTVLNDGSSTKLAEVGSGTLTVSGTGLFQMKSDGSGQLNFSGATGATSGNSTVNLNGGTIKVGSLVRTTAVTTSGIHSFYFNGGTLQAGTNSAVFFPVLVNTTAYVSTNGAVIDSQAFNITNGVALVTDPALGGGADGGLTKLGTGTLTLTNVNTYNGSTLVKAGVLSLSQPSLATGSLVSITTNAFLNLNFSGANTVGTLLLNGASQPAGTYNATTTPGYITGTGSLTVAGVANPVWFGGGPDSNINDAANWGGANPAFDGSATVIFASGGTTATVNTNVSFAGLNFNASGNFLIASGAGVLTNGAGGITTTGAGSPTYTISSKLELAASQTWDVAAANALVVSGAIDDAGAGYGITKTDTGTLTLTGTNTYRGSTTLSAGTLAVSSAQAITNTITVSAGATLAVTISGSSQLSPGTLDLDTYQTLSFAGVASTTTAPVKAGSLINNGTTLINIVSGSFVAGQTYPLIQFTTIGGAGGFVLNSMPSAYAGSTLVTNGNTIALTISATPLVWSGNVNGAWNTSTFNWNGGANTYADGLNVQFDDTASGSTVVSNTATVLPMSILVTNSVNNFTLGGSPIGGGTSLTKSGNGTLTLSGANTFSGGADIQGGTVSLVNAGGLGTGTTVLGDSAMGADAMLQLTGAITVTNNLTVAAGAGARILAASSTGVFASNSITLNSDLICHFAAGNAHIGSTFNGSGSIIASNTVPALSVYFDGVSNNNWTGAFIVAAGIVRPGSTWQGTTNTAVYIGTNNGATFNNGGFNLNIAGFNDIPGVPGGFYTGGSGETTTLNGPGNYSFSGNIGQGGGKLVVQMATGGSQTLTGSNTYSGATTISGGTLALSGSGSIASGTVNVKSPGIFDVSSLSSTFTLGTNQTLTGNGTNKGSVIINGLLYPGNVGIGTLTFNANLTLSATSTNRFVVTTSGGVSNSVAVGGLLSPNGSVVEVNTAGTQLGAGIYTNLFTYGGTTGGTQLASIPAFDTPQTNSTSIVTNDGVGHINLIVTSTVSTPSIIGSITPAGLNSFNLTGTGAASQTYNVYAYTNLTAPMVNWWLIGTTNSTAGGIINFLDTQATNAQRFYRFGQ